MKVLAFLVRWLGFFVGLCALGLVGMALASPFGWPFELFSSWPYLVAAIGLGSAIVVGITGWPRFATGLVAAALVIVALAVASPGDLTRPNAGPPSADITTLVWGNAFDSLENVRTLGEQAARADAAIIAIGETPRETRIPAEVKPKIDATTTKGGISVLGCAGANQDIIENIRAGETEQDRTFAIKVRCPTFKLFAVHLTNPLWQQGKRHTRRGKELEALARAVRSETGPIVVIGDFNTAPNAPAFSRFMQQANLSHSACGGRWLPTWRPEAWRGHINDRSPLTGIPIDHVFTRDIDVASCSVGQDFGSDHLPLIVRLKTPPISNTQAAP